MWLFACIVAPVVVKDSYSVDSSLQENESTPQESVFLESEPDCEVVAETWDGVDEDCDGVIDADGRLEGLIRVQAQAVYEGNLESFSMECPAVFERKTTSGVNGMLVGAVSCVPPQNDAMAQLLLGSTLDLKVDDTVIGAEWVGDLEVVSGAGWDTTGEGRIHWSSMEKADFSGELDSFSLAIVGSGGLE
jgi:hypothetical protein